MTPVSNAVLLEKLESVAAGFARLECKIDSIDLRVQAIEKKDIESHVTNSTQIAAMFKKVDEHEARIKDVEKLMPALRIFVWAATVLGLSVIGMLWAILTGTVTLVH